MHRVIAHLVCSSMCPVNIIIEGFGIILVMVRSLKSHLPLSSIAPSR